MTARIEQLQQGSVSRQEELFDLADDLNQRLEATAQRYSTLITAKLSKTAHFEKNNAGLSLY
ncbi:hypothetical protein [Methyloprofundus sedimenti]|uniref:hypothetical protein n=1 Tax=Methyloprofundus sedimenti TaxID=1420851 RepID=UPI00117DF917|nr:hypothetical protein [Methyloprofundus sedimenti]